MGSKLEFVPISSSINPSFWNKLSEIKLNDDKLNEVAHPVWGYFSNINNMCKIPLLEVNSTSFNVNFESQTIYIPFHGKILNKNTIEMFKECNKVEILNEIGGEIMESIKNGEALKSPSLLNKFFILSFADLKKFFFYYWFAFPVLHKLSITCNSVKNVSEVFQLEQLEDLWSKYCELDSFQKPYFMVYSRDGLLEVEELQKTVGQMNDGNVSEYYFGFYDLSLLGNCPGTTLRNYVTLLLLNCPFLEGKSLNFLALRLKRNEDSKLTISNSLIFDLEMPPCLPQVTNDGGPDSVWVGWEKNERGKLGPRLSNMKSFLDPKELAESSVDLNLKLMKWRLLSNIDLDKIKSTKFLLLGSGTLGCSVARILLGWGARHISFLDNSTVSYSNPVRQSLFTFEDSKTSKPKSKAAADNLKNIFPGVKSKSVQLSIPMPGHTIGESMLDPVKADVEKLVELVREHDVVFLLMDSRESRWLPTVLGTYFDKIVINAALGFDSYLVMRHGVRVDLNEMGVRQHPPGFKSLKGNYLGCYFCNDVTAPGNSMKDRTLDQQCTVTRPGVSAIAGALAAELAISVLQHKEGAKAPAFYQIGNVVNTHVEMDGQCVLGLVPHSIRGYLSSFSQVLPATERYKQCIACSEIVQDAFGKDGFEFLLKVFQDSKYLEDLTGLSILTKEAEDMKVWEFSDEEEIECTNYDEEIASKKNSSEFLEGDRSHSETSFGNAIIQKEAKLSDDMDEEDWNGSEISSDYFDKFAEDVLEKLIGDIELAEKDSCSTLSERPKSDVITILEKRNLISSCESLLTRNCNDNSSTSFSIDRNVSNSKSDVQKPDNTKPVIPKELLPILEKQKATNSGSFRVAVNSRSKFKNEIISLRSKVKNFVSSLALIGSSDISTNRTIIDKSPNIISIKSGIPSFDSSDSQECKGSSFILGPPSFGRHPDSISIKSKFESFNSTYSNEYGKNVELLLKNSLRTSTESSSKDEILSEKVTRKDIVSLGVEDSVYYFAETDSGKSFGD